MRCVLLGTAAFVVAINSSAGQQLTTEYGINLVAIRAPGNRSATPKEAGLWGIPVGSVAHEYRLARSELTTSQWFEFVTAYAPHWTAQGGRPDDFGLLGDWIAYEPPMGQPPSAPGGTYHIAPGTEQWPANMAWRFAARYCNWLQNNKAATPQSFESGAYDASTFTMNPDGSYNDQYARSPGARFWIPSMDEYIKGMFYDPSRYGQGLDGYWLFPDSGNDPLIPGPPGAGGETSGGTELDGLDVEQYPWVQSPWGLLDGSGGVSNWTEMFDPDPFRGSRYVMGSSTGSFLYMIFDRIDGPFGGSVRFPDGGLRIAAAIPAPSTCVVALVCFACIRGRSR